MYTTQLTLKKSGRLTPPAAACGPRGSAASSACSSESTCSYSSMKRQAQLEHASCKALPCTQLIALHTVDLVQFCCALYVKLKLMADSETHQAARAAQLQHTKSNKNHLKHSTCHSPHDRVPAYCCQLYAELSVRLSSHNSTASAHTQCQRPPEAQHWQPPT